MEDRTNYLQGLMHIIKGNLGAGILAMPTSFAHTGLIGAIIGLPLLCLICTYCVQILVRSARVVESKSKDVKPEYASLAKRAFETGPQSIRSYSELIACAIDSTLLVTQIGCLCVYIVFVVDNLVAILASYGVVLSKTVAFASVFPLALLLCCIRTLSRLAIASMVANMLQAIGLTIVVQYLVRTIDWRHTDWRTRDLFRPLDEMALGFGSAMFAFEGISVVLPVYARMKCQHSMTKGFGVINVAMVIVLVLYFVVGLLGYLKFGHEVRDSITLSLPSEPLYDAVRAMFTTSILLSYPLQAYVLFEITWNWAKKNLFKPRKLGDGQLRIEVVAPKETSRSAPNKTVHASGPMQPAAKTLGTPPHTFDTLPNISKQSLNSSDNNSTRLELFKSVKSVESNKTNSHNLAALKGTNHRAAELSSKSVIDINEQVVASKSPLHQSQTQSAADGQDDVPLIYEYFFRLTLVVITFALAFSIPKLNLLMDFIGSFSATSLCLFFPAVMHLATHLEDLRGCSKVAMILIDSTVIIISLVAGFGGSCTSLVSIVKSFK